MSEREAIQQRIADWLRATKQCSAPYGILCDVVTFPRGGHVRTIIFGIARRLNAEIRIWTPTKLELRSSRSDPVVFSTVGALLAFLEDEFGLTGKDR